MSDNPRKIRYALDLLSSFEEMRVENAFCDFTVKAGGKSFPVHRAVLAASSKYFRGMLQSGMIEAREGLITLKEMDSSTAEAVIMYMYSGDTETDLGFGKKMLEAAHLLQLDGLVNKCWKSMQDQLSVDHCITVIELSRTFDRPDVGRKAERYLLENLGEVCFTESFTSIGKSDLIRYLEQASTTHDILWQAVISWVSEKKENRDQLMLELMVVIQVKRFPFQFLLEKITNEELVTSSAEVRNLILQEMFSHEFESNITLDNVFILKQLVEESAISQKIKTMKVLVDFMGENFENLVGKEEFLHLTEQDILMLLQSPDTKSCAEMSKWKAILYWTRHDRCRKKCFTKLFKCLNLERFSTDFIRDKISNESIVNSSRECLQLIVQATLRTNQERESSSVSANPEIVIIGSTVCNWGTVLLFDVNNCTSTTLSKPMDWKEMKYNEFAIVNCEQDVYVFTGRNFFRLDRKNEWVRLKPPPAEIGEWPVMSSLKGKIYLLSSDSNMVSYNPDENDWVTDIHGCGSDPVFSVVTLQNFLYALGGFKRNKATDEVEKFDPSSGNWSSMPSMLEKRLGPSAAVLHGAIIVAGGFNDINYLSSVEYYAVLSRSWTKLSDMKSCHANFTLLTICDKLYACGGDVEHSPNSPYKRQGTIEMYDEETGKWNTLTEEDFLSQRLTACVFPPMRR